MTEDELSELVKSLRAVVSHLTQDPHGNPVEAAINVHRAAAVTRAADAIESLRASLANAERRAEDAEARNVFLETEFLALAEKVKKP